MPLPVTDIKFRGFRPRSCRKFSEYFIDVATIGLPTVVQKIPKISVRNNGAKRILKADRPADLIITNSDERDRLINVESPASMITSGMASSRIEGSLRKVFFNPAATAILFDAIKFN
tara:strand:+ start:152 stop:502 length:351 start_codon:yes stop_codon:yes gene_type:complete